MKQTILVIGGFNKTGYEEVGKKKGNYNVLFHDGIIKRQSTSVFEKMVKQADCVVLLQAACSHKTMWEVKKLSKKYEVPVTYPRSRGVSGAINSAIEVFQNKVSFFAS
ncbi:DUF2325 domain-containing protein [Bacillus sp. S/N-304-OC-R1]|uniref:DUF2325 domain-containing protein n=1 Tax=Bacillus sp. S/N-304-OC-R1 TaxID=2758034 RepID=UPI001C8D6F50|nr:DUF2325 domain-containing protein [Bacillus sp. S/N-304-OC-R1]MBY0124410.1 DUF2325 domain-containing protein [Bacillus sp. S/N-304-OC-R1]